MSKPSPKRSLADDEKLAIAALNRVTFPVASWDKRFHRDVLSPAYYSGEISEKAAAQLWRLFIRYRRQICLPQPEKSDLLTRAQSLAAPDFRKIQSAERAVRMRLAAGCPLAPEQQAWLERQCQPISSPQTGFSGNTVQRTGCRSVTPNSQRTTTC